MMIRFCSLFSGSSGNAIFLRADDTRILIDAGISAKRISLALAEIGEEASQLDAIIVTHEHSDHSSGIGVMSRKYKIPVYANTLTWSGMNVISDSLSSANVRFFENDADFNIGDIVIRPFGIPHDAADPVGFNLFAGSRKITLATDIGHINTPLLDHFTGSDLILIESNHDVEMLRVGRYPWYLKQRILSDSGHLSNDMAGKVVCYLAEKGTQRFMLGHLSKENNFPELAYQTVCSELLMKGITPGKDVELIVALRDKVGQVNEL
jgi:phosphoribosyl 1,2-cyclic phosphodiesterase